MTPSTVSSDPTPPKQPTTAPSPFDKPNADIILRTSDLVDFHVFSPVLVAASPFFEGMFDVPQPPPEQQNLKFGRPIIEVTEDSHALELVLRICYPINKPKSWTLNEIEPALRAAMKYEMELPITLLTENLHALASTSPMEVWEIACHLRLEATALIAGKVLVASKVSVLPFTQLKLEGISAGDYYRLLTFHHEAGKVDRTFQFLSPPSSLPPATDTPNPFPDDQYSEAKIVTAVRQVLLKFPSPDVICSTSNGEEFSVHRSILCATSPLLAEKLAVHLPNDTVISHRVRSPLRSAFSTVPFDEDDCTLAVMLAICYSIHDDETIPTPSSLRSCLSIISCAEKYGLAPAGPWLLSMWREAARKEPLRAYFFAASAGLTEYSAVAARCITEKPLQGKYIPEFETTPALIYHHLWEYYRACTKLTLKHLDDIMSRLHSPSSDPFQTMYSKSKATSRNSLFGGNYVKSTSWMENFVSAGITGVTKSETGPRIPIPALGESFVAATDSSMWCDRCRPLAEDLMGLENKYQKLAKALDEVELHTVSKPPST